ncbi:MAG: methionine biosynthesis protein MetW [Gammaproteobacteria bacterium]|jgi:methionine biosynthesis protein MetW
MRADLRIISELIAPGARVLDLGCGTGDLLAWLQANKSVNGYGLEIDAANITTCMAKGVSVLEQDLDAGLDHFADDAFDMVVMTETLQAVRAPDHLLREMLRIGRECIVTFPNFGHWRSRAQILLRGRMPVARHLPHAWYNTPNIHLCTFDDFERLCRDLQLRIIERFVVDDGHENSAMINRFPNVFGTYAFYRLGRPEHANR